MYAVIKTGGKQYNVTEGQLVKVEKLNAEVGSEVVFDEVILLNKEGNLTVGKPFISGAKVTAEVLDQGRGKKVIAYKFKAKKGYRKKKGHRQPYTLVKINAINA